MAKYTDEQIKNIAECHIKRRCYDCPIGKEDIQRLSKPCSTMISEIILDLINRQKAEYEDLQEQFRHLDIECERLEKANESQEAEIDRLNNELRLKVEYIHEQRDVIDEKKAEIERLKDGCADCPILRAKSETISELYEQIEYWQRGYNDLRQENKTAKSEAIKEFAEKIDIVAENISNLLSRNFDEFTAARIFLKALRSKIQYIVKEMMGESK